MSNRLGRETSPYLLQHADNPVDWYPWGEEAFAAARRRDVPILLSVGYSSCHWCHVMERESFEDDRIATIMNDRFVNVKVDREERPDVDSVYMTAVQAMTGQGGWPMTVFMTPDARPFYGGTYFPPEDRGGLPAFDRVLLTIADAFDGRRGDVVESGRQLIARIADTFAARRPSQPLTTEVMDRAFRALVNQFDDTSGGFGLQPKFPQPATLEFLLRHYVRRGVPAALEMVELTLDKMAAGGIHDQIGGGFHRYSTDAFWLVPHFEKMLYDNALLTRLYTHACQVTGNAGYRQAAQGIVDYVIREMTSLEGGFYSAQDADSEGVEGKFFVWRPEEIAATLGEREARVVCDYYGVTNHGNFEGMSILNVPRDPTSVAARHSIPLDQFGDLIDRAKDKLLAVRVGRVPPMTDTKIITAWNGLMLAAIAEAAAAFGRDDYLEVARTNAAFILDRMVRDGRLRRTDGAGDNGSKGFLDDYAGLIDGLLALHRADGDSRWLFEAVSLTRRAVDLFWDPDVGQFFDTGADQESLIVRPRDVTDNALPSGHSMMAENLIRISTITGDADLRSMAAASLRAVHDIMEQFPTGAGHWLNALDSYLAESREVVVVTGPDSRDAKPMLDRLASEYQAGAVVIVKSEGDGDAEGWPVFEGRNSIEGRPTAYVCRSYACRLPTTDPNTMIAEFLR